MDTSTAIPHLQETENATTRYLAALSALTEEELRAPSLLPGWSRAHVVAHLARNADALANLAHGAIAGEPRSMYTTRDQRDADIAAGARMDAPALKEDSWAAAGRFLQVLNELDVAHLDTPVARMPGQPTFPARDLALVRRMELEVHEADLGLDFSHRDWDPAFADVVLGMVQGDRADGSAMVLRSTDTGGLWRYGVPGQGPEVTGPACELAWWVLGRGDGRALTSDTGTLPTLTPWR